MTISRKLKEYLGGQNVHYVVLTYQVAFTALETA